MKTTIYGASDDLIEIEGQISDEADVYDLPTTFECSDGTKGFIDYDGEWKFAIECEGNLFEKIVRSVGDDSNHTDVDADGATSYSDVLVLNEGVTWVKIGKKKFKQ